jgi:hypothetical protein
MGWTSREGRRGGRFESGRPALVRIKFFSAAFSCHERDPLSTERQECEKGRILFSWLCESQRRLFSEASFPSRIKRLLTCQLTCQLRYLTLTRYSVVIKRRIVVVAFPRRWKDRMKKRCNYQLGGQMHPVSCFFSGATSHRPAVGPLARSSEISRSELPAKWLWFARGISIEPTNQMQAGTAHRAQPRKAEKQRDGDAEQWRQSRSRVDRFQSKD